MKRLITCLHRMLAGETAVKHNPRYDPHFLRYLQDRVRKDARITTIATGDISTVDYANTIIAGGRADLCVVAKHRMIMPTRSSHCRKWRATESAAR